MEHLTPPREFSTPFSQEILDAAIPNTFSGPKAIFTGMEDPDAHLTVFHTQMVLVGGSDAGEVQALYEHVDRDGNGLLHQPSKWPYHLLSAVVAAV